MPHLEEIHTNLMDRLVEAKEQGWLGEVAAIKSTMAAATQKLDAVRTAAAGLRASSPTSAGVAVVRRRAVRLPQSLAMAIKLPRHGGLCSQDVVRRRGDLG